MSRHLPVAERQAPLKLAAFASESCQRFRARTFRPRSVRLQTSSRTSTRAMPPTPTTRFPSRATATATYTWHLHLHLHL